MAITINSTWREEHIMLNSGETRTLYFTDRIKPNTFIFMGATGQIKVGTDRPVSLSYAEMTVKSESTQIFAKPMAVNTLYIGNFNSGAVSVLLYYALADFDPSWLKSTGGDGGGSVELSKPLPSGSNTIGKVTIGAGTENIGKVSVTSLPAELGNVGISSEIPAGTNRIGNVGLVAGTAEIGHVRVNTLPDVDSLPHYRTNTSGTLQRGTDISVPLSIANGSTVWHANRIILMTSIDDTDNSTISIPTVSGSRPVSSLTKLHSHYVEYNPSVRTYNHVYTWDNLCFFSANGFLQFTVVGNMVLGSTGIVADTPYQIITDYIHAV